MPAIPARELVRRGLAADGWTIVPSSQHRTTKYEVWEKDLAAGDAIPGEHTSRPLTRWRLVGPAGALRQCNPGRTSDSIPAPNKRYLTGRGASYDGPALPPYQAG